jgi:hypothetical protein
MAYYPDLSKRHGHRKTLCVGWLDEAHQFETARPAKWMVEKLWSYCKYSVANARGFHECTLADCPGPARKLKHHGSGEKRPTAHELQEQHATRRKDFETISSSGLSKAFKANLLADLDRAFNSALRGYSKMILGVHPDSGERIELGYAEILVFGEHGKIYAAPNMLYHYITVHHYKPPKEFVQALKHGPCPPDADYLDRLKVLGFPVPFLQAYREIWEAEKTRRAAQKLKSV